MSTHIQTIPANSNMYLNGNYAPVQEERDFSSRASNGAGGALHIEGEIPPGLSGSYLRVGSNPVFVKNADIYHWFDGDGMIHALAFDNGEARYRNRFVQTRGLSLEREAGEALWGGVNTPPDLSNPEGPFKNVANTALLVHAGEVLALWEGGPPHVIRTPSLETAGLKDYNGALTHPFSAHPKIDGRTGDMVTYGYGPFGERPIGVSFISPDGRLTKSTTLALRKPVMMHDAALTENYALFMDLPLTFDFGRMQAGGKLLDWEPENGARLGVLPRNGDGDDIRWFEIDPCFVFHTVSAWEEADRIVLTACRMNTPVLLGSTAEDTDRALHEKHTVVRWDIDLSSGRVDETQLHAMGGDFPRFNEAYMGHKHRYAYIIYNTHTAMDFGGVAKMDLETGGVESYDFGPHARASEFIFAPRPNSASEDDGWIISFVRDEAKAESYGVILDAQDIKSGPVARIRIPARVPYGFHATWAPSSVYSD